MLRKGHMPTSPSNLALDILSLDGHMLNLALYLNTRVEVELGVGVEVGMAFLNVWGASYVLPS
jgi:hypothetical protein